MSLGKRITGWVKAHLRKGMRVKGYARGAGSAPKAPAKRKAPATPKAPVVAAAKRKTPAKKAPTRRPAPRPPMPDALRSWQQAQNDAEWRRSRRAPLTTDPEWWIGRNGDDIEFPGT